MITTILFEDCNCGTKSASDRIVGGTNADKNEFPWQVILFAGNSLCGGSIIDDQWILTAAHCVNGIGANQVSVIVGEHNRDAVEGEELFAVSEVIVHEDYVSNPPSNDYALLKLNDKIDFGSSEYSANRICMPSLSNEKYYGQTATVSGWGTTTEGGQAARILQKVRKLRKL